MSPMYHLTYHRSKITVIIIKPHGICFSLANNIPGLVLKFYSSRIGCGDVGRMRLLRIRCQVSRHMPDRNEEKTMRELPSRTVPSLPQTLSARRRVFLQLVRCHVIDVTAVTAKTQVAKLRSRFLLGI